MTLKKQYPIKDGWLHLKITLNRGCSMTEDDVKKYLSMFGGKDAEIAHIDVSRNPVVAVYREKKPEPAPLARIVRRGLITVKTDEETSLFAHPALAAYEGRMIRFFPDFTVRPWVGDDVICIAEKLEKAPR